MSFIIVGIFMQLLLLICLVAFNSKRLATAQNSKHFAMWSSSVEFFRKVTHWLNRNKEPCNVLNCRVSSKSEYHFSDFEVKEIVGSEAEELEMAEEGNSVRKTTAAPRQPTASNPFGLLWLTAVTDRFKSHLTSVWWFFWQTDSNDFDDFKFEDFASLSLGESRHCTSTANHFILKSSLARRGKTVSPFRPNDLYFQARSRIKRKLLKIEASMSRGKKARRLSVISELPEWENSCEK